MLKISPGSLPQFVNSMRITFASTVALVSSALCVVVLLVLAYRKGDQAVKETAREIQDEGTRGPLMKSERQRIKFDAMWKDFIRRRTATVLVSVFASAIIVGYIASAYTVDEKEIEQVLCVDRTETHGVARGSSDHHNDAMSDAISLSSDGVGTSSVVGANGGIGASSGIGANGGGESTARPSDMDEFNELL
jgi:hypothetical protein